MRNALKLVGGLDNGGLAQLFAGNETAKDKMLSIIDPLAHRQGSKEPFKYALEGPGFESVEEALALFHKNPNADVFPKLDTRDWSASLKRALFPAIEYGVDVTKAQGNYELTALNMANLLNQIHDYKIALPPGRPNVQTPPVTKLSKANWEELEGHLNQLALQYVKTLKANE